MDINNEFRDFIPCYKCRGAYLNQQAEIDRLKEEIDFLQRYGNKDCTAMAYEALGKHRKGE